MPSRSLLLKLPIIAHLITDSCLPAEDYWWIEKVKTGDRGNELEKKKLKATILRVSSGRIFRYINQENILLLAWVRAHDSSTASHYGFTFSAGI